MFIIAFGVINKELLLLPSTATELTWGYQVEGNLSEWGFLRFRHPEEQNQANWCHTPNTVL